MNLNTLKYLFSVNVILQEGERGGVLCPEPDGEVQQPGGLPRAVCERRDVGRGECLSM